jgi:hypothetical protein
MKENIREAVSKVLNEQRFLKFIAKYGDDFFKKMFKSDRVSKATISKLEDVFNETSNLGKLRDGTEVIRLQPQRVGNVNTNPFVKLEDIQSDLEKLNDRLITKDDILKKYGPMKLQDGTSLSDIFLPKFSEKLKANLKVRLKPTVDGTEIKQAFKQGYKTQQAGSLMFRWGKYLVWRNRLNRLNKADKNKVYLWFFSGIGDAKSIRQIFKDNNVTDSLILSLSNIGGQLTKKFVWWTCVLTAVKFLIGIGPDIFNKKYDTAGEALWERFKQSLTIASPELIAPATIVWNTVIDPLLVGGIFENPEKFYKSFDNLGAKADGQLQSVIDYVKNTTGKQYQKVKKITPEVPKKTTTTPTTDEPERTW